MEHKDFDSDLGCLYFLQRLSKEIIDDALNPCTGDKQHEAVKTDCLGCQNIIQGNFPTRYNTIHKAFVLDTEGCWDGGNERDRDGSDWYIYFCPVCGRSLKELDNEQIR